MPRRIRKVIASAFLGLGVLIGGTAAFMSASAATAAPAYAAPQSRQIYEISNRTHWCDKVCTPIYNCC